MKKQEPKWIGNGHVQTDDQRWQVRMFNDHDVDSSLKEHIARMQEELLKHPDAWVEVENYEEPYSTSSYAKFFIRWWEDVTADHPEVKKYLKRQEDEAFWQKEREDREIESLRQRRPELFKET